MLVLFTSSISIHWITAWYAFEEEQKSHNQPIEFNTYLIEVTRQTFENIQSEMLQLMLQIVLIAYLWFVGSPSSHSEEERMEEKISWLMSQINPIEAQRVNEELERRFPKK
jgi:hypothetical protein